MKYLCHFLLFSCIGLSVQKSTPQDDHYVGAVVEYIVNGNVATNLANYASLIKEAAEQGADIVVFPELTLTNSSTYFTVPIHGALRQYPIPALYPLKFDEFMVGISTAARENDIYVVINGRERMDCTAQDTASEEYCPEAKEYIFNTNVVFNRIGAVIDRFRKINLFGEYTHTPALRPELGLFTTDFGVTFGHFICFDLMFQVPAVQVVQKSQVKDVIFPTMWFSELPYLTAVQIQEAYAYALDVNFLGAGANNVRVGSAGSGIYSGKAGALISIMPGLPTTKLLVAKVPKVPGQVTEPYPGPIYDNPADHDSLRLITDLSLPSHVSRLLEVGSQEFTLVHRDTTCTFKVTLAQRDSATSVRYRAFIEDGTRTYARREIGVASCLLVACKTDDVTTCSYRYRAGVFSGVRSFSGIASGGTRICGVYACTGDTRETCGLRFSSYIPDTTAIFEELVITARIPTPAIVNGIETNNAIMYPVSSKVSIMPLESEEFEYTTSKYSTNSIYTMTLKNRSAELYTFAIWGRRFATDGQTEDPPLTDAEGDLTPASTTEGASTVSSVTDSTTTQATTTTPVPGASAIHLLSRVLLASVGALIYYSQL